MSSSSHTTQQKRHALRTLLGEERCITHKDDMTPYVSERRQRIEGQALGVIFPETEDDVVAIVRYAQRYGIGLVPQGGHSGLAGAACPTDKDNHVVVAMGRMNHIRVIDGKNATLIAQAGCTLAQIQDALADRPLFFPLDIASRRQCQLGGLVATNAGGVHVLRYGMMGALVRGIRAVLADGSVMDDLTCCLKDNTGYALHSLFCGSEGTLGIICDVALALYRRPRRLVSACFAVRDIGKALRLYDVIAQEALSSLPMPLHAFEYIDGVIFELVLSMAGQDKRPLRGTYPAYVMAQWEEGGEEEGDEGMKAHAFSSFREMLHARGIIEAAVRCATPSSQRALWDMRWRIHDTERRYGDGFKHDIALPLHRWDVFLQETTRAVQESVPHAPLFIFGHLAEGNLHYNIGKPPMMAQSTFERHREPLQRYLYDSVRAFGGSFSAEHGVGRLKREELKRYKAQGTYGMMRKLKEAFDPHHIMNPGVFFSSYP
ncbi:MAG: FAD-binding oxidoreductase [Alphaproteobacteria bacterium GM7ARS4]|nr:FAD-binding oxidoreductase [Alphaproteobacteria bacterium GM7ARS4]